MDVLAQAKRLLANLLALGTRRLIAAGVIGFAVFAMTGFAGYYLSRPTMETLYSGLDREDVIGIGSALREAGISSMSPPTALQYWCRWGNPRKRG